MIYQGEIPFEIKAEIPNETTMAALEAAEKGENMIGPFNSVEELMETLNAED